MMIEPSLTLQTLIRERLLGDPTVVKALGLVPASNVTIDHGQAAARIVDGNVRPGEFPFVRIGDATGRRDPLVYAKDHYTFALDVHAFTDGEALAPVKAIAGTLWQALRAAPPELHAVRWEIESVRFLRGPKGEYAHAVLTIETTFHVRTLEAA